MHLLVIFPNCFGDIIYAVTLTQRLANRITNAYCNHPKSTILKIVNEVLDANQQSITDFKNGKDRAFGFLVGQIMKKTNGQVNPKMASEILTKEINKR